MMYRTAQLTTLLEGRNTVNVCRSMRRNTPLHLGLVVSLAKARNARPPATSCVKCDHRSVTSGRQYRRACCTVLEELVARCPKSSLHGAHASSACASIHSQGLRLVSPHGCRSRLFASVLRGVRENKHRKTVSCSHDGCLPGLRQSCALDSSGPAVPCGKTIFLRVIA